jgi:hypothetical protein
MDRRAHTVQDILCTLQRELRVDAEWVMPIDNGFQWWPGPLAQRIWIEDTEPKRLHIETDVLRDVAIDEKNMGLVAYGNRFAMFNTLILRSDDRSLRLHASILLSSERNSADANCLAVRTAARQAVDADAKCRFLAEAFGADPDITSHPNRGPRESGHVVLRFLDALRAENEKAGSLSKLDFTP